MPDKGRRIASRQAELAARGRRRMRQVPSMSEPQLFTGTRDEAEATQAGAPETAVRARAPFGQRGNAAPTSIVTAMERSIAYQNVGSELRKIGILAVIVLVALVAMMFALRLR